MADLDKALQIIQDADPEQVAERLQQDASAVHKAIRNPAYQEGKEDAQSELSDAQSKIASLRKEKQELQNEVEELEEEQPNLAEVRGQYKQQIESLQEKIESLEQQNEEIRKESNQTLQQKQREFIQEQAKSKLMSQFGVTDEDIAEIKVQRAMDQGLVELNEDLEPEVYDEDGVPVRSKGNPVDAFAEQVASKVPQKFRNHGKPSSTRLGETGSGSKRVWTEDEIESMSDAEYEEHRDDILEAMNDGRVKKS